MGMINETGVGREKSQELPGWASDRCTGFDRQSSPEHSGFAPAATVPRS